MADMARLLTSSFPIAEGGGVRGCLVLISYGPFHELLTTLICIANKVYDR